MLRDRNLLNNISLPVNLSQRERDIWSLVAFWNSSLSMTAFLYIHCPPFLGKERGGRLNSSNRRLKWVVAILWEPLIFRSSRESMASVGVGGGGVEWSGHLYL